MRDVELSRGSDYLSVAGVTPKRESRPTECSFQICQNSPGVLQETKKRNSKITKICSQQSCDNDCVLLNRTSMVSLDHRIYLRREITKSHKRFKPEVPQYCSLVSSRSLKASPHDARQKSKKLAPNSAAFTSIRNGSHGTGVPLAAQNWLFEVPRAVRKLPRRYDQHCTAASRSAQRRHALKSSL